MKKILLFFVFLSSLFLQAQEKLIINDPLAVMRDMGIFDEIDVRGPFKVYYSVGKKHTVAISAGTESARDRIRVSKSGSRLIIELEDTYKDWFKSQPRFKIYISSPTVNYISASGAVDFFVTD
ncbi:MAG: hypothetical protein EBU80_04275, partial [Chitinophagia bacterium]|nr:hypothetical protein [Chitinophagia bacterium]